MGQDRDRDRERKRLKLLEEIIDLTPALICVVDLTGVFVMVNDAWHTMLGYTKEELLHSSLIDFLHPDDREPTTQIIHRLRSGEKVLHYVNRYRAEGGNYLTLDWRAHISDGLIYGTARDISQEMADLQQKQRELDIMNLLFEQTLTGMFSILLTTPIDWQQVVEDDRLLDEMLQESRIERANSALLEQFRASESQIIGMRASELFQLESSRTHTMFRNLLVQKKISAEVNMQRFDGSDAWFQGEYHCLTNEQGEIVGFFGMQIDVTERRESALALRQSEHRYRLITEHASDVIWVYDFEQKQFTYMSPSVERFIGYTPEEVIGKAFEFSIHPDHVLNTRKTLTRMLKDFKRASNNSKQWTFEVRHIRKDGSSLWADASVNFRLRSRGGVEAIGVSRDISMRKAYEDKILHLSFRDQLTGLYNRRYFEQQLEALAWNSKAFPVSILVCDVNGLKLTNDVFGHQIGDRLLTSCADVLLAHKQEGDVVARVGGDEYIVLMYHTTEDEARDRVVEIQQSIAEKRIGETRLSVSFGCATAYDMVESFEPIFKQAEDAMYRQKLMESSSYKHNLIKILIRGLYEKGEYERCHSERVAELCYRMGKLFGFSDAHLNELKLAGMFHDIGKVGISSTLLNQKRPLSADEWTQIHRHPELGYHILRSVQSFERLADWVLAHHEQPNGKGYPRGLKNDTIPIESRIIAVANAYDAMTSEYGYRQPITVEEAKAELQTHAGTQFDPQVVQKFLSIPLTDLNCDPEDPKEAMNEQLRPS